MVNAKKKEVHNAKPTFIRSGRAYIVRDKIAWYSLPIVVRKTTIATIERVFTFGKIQVMRVRTVDEGQVPAKIEFKDAVTRLYANNILAAWNFRYHVYNQVNQLSKRVPQLKDLLLTLRGAKYKVDVGRAFALKWKYKTNNQTQLTCVSESVVALREIFGNWALWTKQPQDFKLNSLEKAPKQLQESFGMAIGKVIAHELMHQLAPSDNGVGLDHTGNGLGTDNPSFWDPKIEFSSKDQQVILSSIRHLVKLQDHKSIESISRNDPY